MKKATFLLASAALSMSLAGCTVTTSTSPSTPAANTNTAKPAAAPTTPAPAANTNAATPTAAAPSGEMSNLTIFNKTKWAVHHLYLSPAKENEWGQDQLGDKTIDPGGSYKLTDIPCNTYDIKVVDEDGDECVIQGEKFCGHEATWNLTQDELLSCEGYGEK